MVRHAGAAVKLSRRYLLSEVLVFCHIIAFLASLWQYRFFFFDVTALRELWWLSDDFWFQTACVGRRVGAASRRTYLALRYNSRKG